jgi:hypothetical protein
MNIGDILLEDEDKHSEGTYACLKMSEDSAKALVEWCKEHSIPVQDADEMHCTLIYSKKPVPHFEKLIGSKIKKGTAEIKTWKRLGDTMTLLLDFPLAERVQKQMIEMGATNDFKSYLCHVSIKPDWPEDKPTPSSLPNMKLEFDKIEVKALDDKPDSKEAIEEGQLYRAYKNGDYTPSEEPCDAYLLHFETPYQHAQHYAGITKPGGIKSRVEAHRSGKGALLTTAAAKAGIKMAVAQTWENVPRSFELKLKSGGGLKRVCPICKKSAVKAPTSPAQLSKAAKASKAAAQMTAEGVGRIVQGVNTTDDVGVNQTQIEAAKLGLYVDKGGYPPVLKTNKDR